MEQQKVKTEDFKASIFHSEQLIIYNGDSKEFFDWLETNNNASYYHYECIQVPYLIIKKQRRKK